MKPKIVGDEAYLWFPINRGYKPNYQWVNLHKVASKQGFLTIMKDVDGPSIHDTS